MRLLLFASIAVWNAGWACAAKEGDVQLVEGKTNEEGAVQYYHCTSSSSCSWGYVCDNIWTDADASVVCRQLGLKSSTAVGQEDAESEYGFTASSTSLTYFDNIVCTGNEANLDVCSFDSYDGGKGCKAAGVACEGIESALHLWTILAIVVVLICIISAFFLPCCHRRRASGDMEKRGLEASADTKKVLAGTGAEVSYAQVQADLATKKERAKRSLEAKRDHESRQLQSHVRKTHAADGALITRHKSTSSKHRLKHSSSGRTSEKHKKTDDVKPIRKSSGRSLGSHHQHDSHHSHHHNQHSFHDLQRHHSRRRSSSTDQRPSHPSSSHPHRSRTPPMDGKHRRVEKEKEKGTRKSKSASKPPKHPKPSRDISSAEKSHHRHSRSSAHLARKSSSKRAPRPERA